MYVYIHTSASATPLTHLPLDHLSLPLFFFTDPATAVPQTTHHHPFLLHSPKLPVTTHFFLTVLSQTAHHRPFFYPENHPSLPIFSYCIIPNRPSPPIFPYCSPKLPISFLLPITSRFFIQKNTHHCPFFLTALSQTAHHHPFFLTALSQTTHHCPFFSYCTVPNRPSLPIFSYCTIPNCLFLPIFLTMLSQTAHHHPFFFSYCDSCETCSLVSTIAHCFW